MTDFDTNELITKALEYFGFGVTIEVTNGSGNRDKVVQAVRNKRFLESFAQDSVVKGGLALFKRTEGNESLEMHDSSKDMNLIMNLTNYNAERLEHVCNRLVDSRGMINPEDRKLLQRIVLNSYDGYDLESLLYPEKPMKKDLPAEFRGMNLGRYKKSLCNIKGHIMEMYMAVLFNDYIPRSFIFKRVNYSVMDEKGVFTSDIDSLIITSLKSFEKAILGIGNNREEGMNVIYKP